MNEGVVLVLMADKTETVVAQRRTERLHSFAHSFLPSLYDIYLLTTDKVASSVLF